MTNGNIVYTRVITEPLVIDLFSCELHNLSERIYLYLDDDLYEYY